jgi:DNA-binding response OmpR family regulator
MALSDFGPTLLHRASVDPGIELITKPFTCDELAARVRDILDHADRAPGRGVRVVSSGSVRLVPS